MNIFLKQRVRASSKYKAYKGTNIVHFKILDCRSIPKIFRFGNLIFTYRDA